MKKIFIFRWDFYFHFIHKLFLSRCHSCDSPFHQFPINFFAAALGRHTPFHYCTLFFGITFTCRRRRWGDARLVVIAFKKFLFSRFWTHVVYFRWTQVLIHDVRWCMNDLSQFCWRNAEILLLRYAFGFLYCYRVVYQHVSLWYIAVQVIFRKSSCALKRHGFVCLFVCLFCYVWLLK